MSCHRRPLPDPSPVRCLLAFIAATALLACAGETDPPLGPGSLPDPVAVGVSISPSALSLIVGGAQSLTGRAYDAEDRTTNAIFEWSSADTAVAKVGKTNGVVFGIAPGTTTVTAAVGSLRATASVNVWAEPAGLFDQWAISATASSEYTAAEWSANQATGMPDVSRCADHPAAWASVEQAGVDWLELTYAEPVRPSVIRIHEVWGVGSIVKVEVKDLAGVYQTVYSAQPLDAKICPHILAIEVKDVTAMVSKVRVSVDQRLLNDWNEIDAVRLSGYR